MALRAKLGSLPLSDLLAPAITYADEGFPVSDVIAAHWAALTDKLAGEPNAPRTSICRTAARRAPARCSGTRISRSRSAASPRTAAAGFYEGPTADAILAISRRQRRHDDRRRSPRARARMGRSDLDHLSRLDRVRAAAEHAGHRRADDAQPDGAVPARRVRLPQLAGAARDDRGEEARLRRHAAVRRRHALLGSAGRGAARQGARRCSGPSASAPATRLATCSRRRSTA